MSKKNGLGTRELFAAAALLSKGDRNAFLAILQCFIAASAPQDGLKFNHTDHQQRHTAQAQLLTRFRER